MESSWTVLWDFENMPFAHTTPLALREHVRAMVAPRRVRDYRAYASAVALSGAQREALARAGWHLVDCPPKGGKQAVDLRIVLDAAFTTDDVVLLSGDGDFAPLLCTMRDQGRVSWVVYDRTRTQITHADLLHAASHAIGMEDDGEEMPRDPATTLVDAVRASTPDAEGWVCATDVGCLFHKLVADHASSKAQRKQLFRDAVRQLVENGTVTRRDDNGVVLLRM